MRESGNTDLPLSPLTLGTAATILPALLIKHPMMFPRSRPSHASSLAVKHCGVGFPILKLYIKRHFKRTTGGALQGPGGYLSPPKETPAW